MTSAPCPGCEASISIFDCCDDPSIGDHVQCQECGELLEIVSTDPLEFEIDDDFDEEDN